MYLSFRITVSLILGLFLVAPIAWALDEDVTGIAIESTGEAITDPIESLQAPLSGEIDTLPGNDIPEEVSVEDRNGELSLEDETGTYTQALIQKDVVLVLDNSGSMKKNDPQFLTNQAVTQFISGLDEATRVAIVIFDQDVRLSVPLTDISLETRETILGSLEQINYKGLFTDSPAGIERAIYELKINGREEAQKLIVFMTDGIVDTGDANRDLEKAKWLKEDLSADAADSAIKIFGIAFTNAADFELIQSLAQKTEGEYYRALQAQDLQKVFDRINKIINTPPPEPEPVVEPIKLVEEPQPAVEPAPPVEPVAPPPPVIIEVPVQPIIGEEERIRSIIIITAAGVLIITLLVILILLLRRNRDMKAAGDEYIQEAYLNDIHGFTDKQTHKLGSKPIMMGRVAGKDTEHLDYIVVPESTIGRRHALIEYKDYAFWIADQGSINGTFVNSQPVTSDVRLKHGDRIRLHKCEFEFAMPEMEDSSKTMISNTVFAGEIEDHSEEATEIRGGHVEEMGLDAPEIPDSAFDLDIDITGDAGDESVAGVDPDEEDTIIRGSYADESPVNSDSESDSDSDDETIMLDDRDELSDDQEDELDNDATIRPDDV